MLIVCTDSGTVLRADRCKYLNSYDLLDSEWEAFDEGGDAEVIELAEANGRVAETDLTVVRLIVNLINGSEWSADTVDQIADLLREAGYTIADVSS